MYIVLEHKKLHFVFPPPLVLENILFIKSIFVKSMKIYEFYTFIEKNESLQNTTEDWDLKIKSIQRLKYI